MNNCKWFLTQNLIFCLTLIINENYNNILSVNKGQEEASMTKEDMENTSGEGEQECWFGKGYHESSKKESGSWRDCC